MKKLDFNYKNDSEEVVFVRDNSTGSVTYEVKEDMWQMPFVDVEAQFQAHIDDANKGVLESILYLTNYYVIRKDFETALIYFKIAAKPQPNLLSKYYDCLKKVKLSNRTFPYLIDVAIKGHKDALAKLYDLIDKDAVPFFSKDEKKAMYMKFYTVKNKIFAEKLGDILFEQEDYSKALILYNDAHELGILKNYQNIADLYYVHTETPNLEKSLEYYRKCNNAYSKFRIAEFFEKGYVVEKNLDKAYLFYERSIVDGYPYGKYKILNYVIDKRNKNYNPSKAYKYAFEATYFNKNAYHYLGLCYYNAIGTPRNYIQAFKCFVKSQNITSIKNIADCYANGFGVEQDCQKAIDLYSKVKITKGVEKSILDCYIKLEDYNDKTFNLLKRFVIEEPENLEYLYLLALLYLDEESENYDINSAIRHLTTCVNLGDLESEYLLGTQLIKTNEPSSIISGLQNVKSAAEKDHFKSILYLFNYYKESEIDIAYDYALKIQGNGNTEVLRFLAANSLGRTTSEVNLRDSFEFNLDLIEQGDKTVFNTLGDFYYQGLACEVNYEEAFKYYTLASTTSDGNSLYNLGSFYENGIAVDQSKSMAYNYYNEAVEQGNINAKCVIANFYAEGIHFSQNYETAISLYKELSEENSYAVYKLGTFYELGLGCAQNIKEALNCYNQALEQGELCAALKLGNLYEEGILVKKDYNKALNYYKQIAIYNEEAQYKIGRIYELGLAGKVNLNEAIIYYSKACNRNHPIAQCILGDIYYNGINTEVDYQKAALCYEAAVRADYYKAYYGLGNCYYNGYGLLQNYQKAYECYNAAYYKDDNRGEYGLANCYFNGYGVEQDYEKAFGMYLNCATEGVKEAFAKVGECYENGYGVEKDEAKAMEYLRHSVDNSSDNKLKMGLHYIKDVANTEGIKLGIEFLEDAIELEQYEAALHLAQYYDSISDFEKAFKMYRIAFEASINEAKRKYAVYLFKGIGTAKNPKEAFDILLEPQFNQDKEIQYLIGCYYKENVDTPQDVTNAVKHLTVAASLNHEDAIVELANLYFEGTLVNQDYKEAFELFNQVVETKNPIVLSRLAYFYKTGVHCVKDLRKALELYTQIVDVANSDDINNLGEIYYYQEDYEKAYELYVQSNTQKALYNQALCLFYGHGIEEDKKLAVRKLETLAKAEEHNSINFLGELCIEGNYLPQNYEKAISCFSHAESLGNEKALTNLAECYINATGVEKNYDDAQTILFRGVSNPTALNYLGVLYEKGLIKKDLVKAFECYSKAAELGNDEANYNLARFYTNGISCEKDLAKSYSLFRSAAQGGHIRAAYELGIYYYEGIVVEKNYEVAYRLFTFSKQLIESINKLGECHFNGYGVAKDEYKAVSYYKEAADSGNGLAQYNLGKCYHEGRGLSPNKVTIEGSTKVSESVSDLYLAKKYYELAVKNKIKEADDALDVVEKILYKMKKG